MNMKYAKRKFTHQGTTIDATITITIAATTTICAGAVPGPPVPAVRPPVPATDAAGGATGELSDLCHV